MSAENQIHPPIITNDGVFRGDPDYIERVRPLRWTHYGEDHKPNVRWVDIDELRKEVIAMARKKKKSGKGC